jgi:hypothetical protein
VPRMISGVILGVSIGIADVLLMLPLSFPDKRTALLAAFSSRSGIAPLIRSRSLLTDDLSCLRYRTSCSVSAFSQWRWFNLRRGPFPCSEAMKCFGPIAS